MTASIPIKNIYYMLSYSYKELKHSAYQRCGREEFAHIYDLLTEILIIGLKPLTKRGLYHTYEPHQDILTSVRGKIDINGSIQLALQRRRALQCEFDEFMVDNLYNQIIKSTISVLLRQTSVCIAQKTVLKQLYYHFGTVTEFRDVSRINWKQLTYHQHNQHYRLLLHICKFIIDCVIIDPSRGTYLLDSFVDTQRMSQLYESFVRDYFRYHYPQLKPGSPFIDWQVSDGDVYQLPRMKSDIVLTGAVRSLIIDTKYYSKSMQQNYDTYKLHSSHLYQMFTYLKNYVAPHHHDVAGLILYAKTDATVAPNTSVVMSGHRLSVKSLDLNTEFAQIKAQLDAIIQENFGIGDTRQLQS
jgi:5-methylcytosine-specific restriction enzyme subunit McrC